MTNDQNEKRQNLKKLKDLKELRENLQNLKNLRNLANDQKPIKSIKQQTIYFLQMRRSFGSSGLIENLISVLENLRVERFGFLKETGR